MQKCAFLSDIHFPYQDDEALNVTEQFLEWFNPDRIILLGDIMDAYPLSSFEQDPKRLLSFQGEIDETKAFLARLRDAHPTANIEYMEGNHEDRLRRVRWSNPQLGMLEVLALDKLLDLEALRIKHRGYKDIFTIGDYSIEHGHVSRKLSCYTARAMVDARGSSGITGHTHRMGAYHQTIGSNRYTWFENGCLCELDPPYVIGRPNWQHGFTVGYLNGTQLHPEQIAINNGALHYAGGLWLPK